MKSQDWHAQRAHAERVTCPDCHAPAGRTCRRVHDGRELAGPPAHIARIKLADEAQHARTADAQAHRPTNAPPTDTDSPP